jgi:SPP1 gp7 family putative phage head morphogenesis protein
MQKAADRRAELLLRTHGQQAYATTQYKMMDEQRDLFPFWQYLSMGDSHVRATHAALDGVVLPADSEFWTTHFPPWDWGCRCQCAG